MKSTFLREDRVLSREVTLQVRTSDKYKKENKHADDEWERAAAENRCVRWGGGNPWGSGAVHDFTTCVS